MKIILFKVKNQTYWVPYKIININILPKNNHRAEYFIRQPKENFNNSIFWLHLRFKWSPVKCFNRNHICTEAKQWPRICGAKSGNEIHIRNSYCTIIPIHVTILQYAHYLQMNNLQRTSIKQPECKTNFLNSKPRKSRPDVILPKTKTYSLIPNYSKP